jgi:hypothetical protein
MSINNRPARCTPDAVFAVLSDGWLYATWVVGASRIRAVDEQWPAVGSELHHSVGTWPLLLDDSTKVIDVDPPAMLRLKARAWPSGEAHVELRVEPTPAGCMITIEEHPSTGPAQIVPGPIMDALLHVRNEESLRRLVFLAEGRARVDPTHGANDA